MTTFRNEARKNIIDIIFLNLPMVAISQRSIPKDQLYENKKGQDTLFCNYRTCTQQLRFKGFLFSVVHAL